MSEPAPVHVMLDLETMGTAPGSMIAAIGACTFVTDAPRQTFYARVELRGQDRLGLTIDPDTVLWWLAQDEPAREELTHPSLRRHRQPLAAALTELHNRIRWWSEGRELRLWANGANFDPGIAETAWRACFPGTAPAWRYHEVRCVRTLLELAGVDRKAFPPRVAHHALHDALAQADAAEAAFHALLDSRHCREVMHG